MENKLILGAIAGNGIESYISDPFSSFTDATIMTVAYTDWGVKGNSFLNIKGNDENKYPFPGHRFRKWMTYYNSQTYNIFSKNPAMWVSPVGWVFKTLEETLVASKQSAFFTHAYPEGVKGAQATAACIYWARKGKTKQQIKEYVEALFGYDLNRTCDEIRPTYEFEPSCQKTVPKSIIAFLESTDFESAIRLAVSLGGDADTMGAITGGIAEAYYGGVPDHIRKEVLKRLPKEFIDVMSRFYQKFVEK